MAPQKKGSRPVPRHLRPAVALMLLATLLAGCTGEAEDGDPYRFAEPAAGDAWRVTADDGRTFTVTIDTATEFLADGTRAERPIMRLDRDEPRVQPLPGGGQTSSTFVSHWISDNGTAGVRADADRAATALAGSRSWAKDDLAFTPNILAFLEPVDPPWIALGVGLWGKEVRGGDASTQPVALVTKEGLRPVDARLEFQPDGADCARVAVVIDQTPHIRSRFCGGSALPETVDVLAPQPAMFTFEQTAHGDGMLPEAPQAAVAASKPYERVPPDGSDLLLTLEAALAALEADVQTGGWLADHGDAVAVRGLYEVDQCGPPPASTCLLASDGPTTEVAWTLDFVDPTGDGLRATVARPALPGAVPAVTLRETGTDTFPEDLPVAVASLQHALAVRDGFHAEGFSFKRVFYDLRAPEPSWSIVSNMEPTASEGAGGTLGQSVVVAMDNGSATFAQVRD